MPMHRRFKITARKVRDRAGPGFRVTIDGHPFWTVPGTDQDTAVASAARYVDASIERPDAYAWTRDLTPDQLAAKLAS